MRVKKFGITISLIVFIVAAAMMGGLIGGFSNTINEFDIAVKKNTADAILASSAIDDETTVSVPILYYDQQMDDCINIYDAGMQSLVNSRQFEWKSCGYYGSGIEAGLVEAKLDSQYLPIGVSGTTLPNRGIGDGFDRWFNQIDGKSRSYAGVIKLSYNEDTASFEYENDKFYPLDEINLASNESVNIDGHNHLFTLNLGIPFRVLANGSEEFSIMADDDTWVFVGDTLVIDMGGVHDVMIGKFKIYENGEIYTSVDNQDFAYTGVNVVNGEGAIVRVFHADRNSENSHFGLKMINMVPNVINSTIAQGSDGVEIAYDPTNPSYVAPLGESLSVGPSTSKSLVAMMTAQIVGLGALGALIVMTISVAWRYSRRDRNQVK